MLYLEELFISMKKVRILFRVAKKALRKVLHGDFNIGAEVFLATPAAEPSISLDMVRKILSAKASSF
jgi:hypothetical protein